MLKKLFIEDIKDFENKLVKVRVDFNVPLVNKQVENLKRVEATLPTLKYLLKNNARIVLISHLGRPGGVVDPEYSLEPVVLELEKLLNNKVQFVHDCIGSEVDQKINSLKKGEILLLENLRFYIQEKNNDLEFSKRLAKDVDIFINDAFGTSHRAHASTQGITKFIDKCASGYLLKKELDCLGKVLDNPESPFTVISGGAKISDKIMMIENMLNKVDCILIGGAMTYTFLKAKGYEIGKSLVEMDKVDLAKKLIDLAGDKLILPIDSNCSDKIDFKARTTGSLRIEKSDQMQKNSIGLDIGPETVELYKKHIIKSKTVVWNGPMGVFEIEKTAKGTFAIAEALKEATQKGANTIVGGGDSAAAIEKSGYQNEVSHISTGGGACLELLEGKKMPGIESLTDI